MANGVKDRNAVRSLSEPLHNCLPQHKDVFCSEDAMLLEENCKRERQGEVDLTSIPMVKLFRDPA